MISFSFFFSKITSKFAIFFLVTDCCGSFLHVEHKPLVKSAAIFIYIIYTCSHGYIQKYKAIHGKKKKKKKLKLYTQLKHLKHNVHSFWYTGFISSYWRDNVIQMWRQTDTLKHFSNDSEARQVFGWQIQFRKHVETKCRATLQCLTQFLNAVWAKWIIKKPIHPLSSLKKGKKNNLKWAENLFFGFWNVAVSINLF